MSGRRRLRLKGRQDLEEEVGIEYSRWMNVSRPGGRKGRKQDEGGSLKPMKRCGHALKARGKGSSKGEKHVELLCSYCCSHARCILWVRATQTECGFGMGRGSRLVVALA